MATYHVSKHGSASNSNGGTNATTDAWATITASVVKLVAGDILEVHTGTYAESVTPGGLGGVSWVSGASGNPITIRAFGSTDTSTKGVSAGTDAVVIRPSSGTVLGFNKNDAKYINISGFVLDGGGSSDSSGLVFNNDANNIIIRHCEIKDMPDDGIAGAENNGSATTDRNIVMTYLYVHNCGTLHSGVAKHGVYWRTRGSIFDHCDIANNDVSAIQFYNGSANARNAHNCIIRYCVLRDNQTEYHFQQGGVSIGPDITNVKVHNNLIYAHRDFGIGMSAGAGTSSGHFIYNNTIVDIGNAGGNGMQGIRCLSSNYSDVQVKNNLIWDTVGSAIEDTYSRLTASNNWLKTSNPNFNGYTRGSAWDLDLTGSTPSTILAGGADLGAEYYEDFAGNTRSGTFSMGAYANEVAIPDPPLDPVILYPTPLSVTKNINKLLTDIQAQDNNDPDVGNYTLRLVLMGNGTLNDGV